MKAFLIAGLLCGFLESGTQAQVAVKGDLIYTMSGEPIRNGVVLTRGGKIERIGTAAQVAVPAGYQTLQAKIVTPGLIDAHTAVGLTGYLNQSTDQDMIEKSAAIQPELRAIDSYDAQERLIEWVRSFGVTTIHTGHAPGAAISGQTMVAKTVGDTVEKSTLVPAAMIAATLGNAAKADAGKSPGTKAKVVAILRTELIKAQEYSRKPPAVRDLHLEALVPVIKGEMPLLVTVNRSADILTAIRMGKEFNLKIVLDGVAEAYLVLDQIKASGYPVIVHPTMQRSFGDTENLTMENASKLRAAGIPFALQSSFEGYVPKTRVVLFEAAVAAANGLTFPQALASITIDAAKLIGLDKRLGSLEVGKDADLALYDGDPFEYTTHCTGVVIDGKVISTTRH